MKKKITKLFNNKRLLLYAILIIISATAIVCAIKKQKNAKIYVFPNESFSNKVESNESGELLYKSTQFSIPSGNYSFFINLSECNLGNEPYLKVSLYLDNDIFETQDFSGADIVNETVTIPFCLDEPTDQAYFTLASATDISCCTAALFSDKDMFNDYYFYAFLFIFLIVILILINVKFPFIVYKKQWLILGAICVVVCIPIFTCGQVTMLTDTRAHLLRIEGIYKGFLDGQAHVLIYPNANNQFGQTGTMYPSLFLYIPAMLRLLNISMFAAFKFTECLVHIATVLVTFFCGKCIFKDDNKALLISFLYAFDFHRIGVAYNGGGLLGNGIAMIFFPLIILGLYSIFYESGRYWWSLPLGLSLVFYSHVLSLAMMLVLVAVFSIINIKKLFKKEILVTILKSVIVFLLLSAGNIYAFLRFYILGIETNILASDYWMKSLVDFNYIIRHGNQTYVNDAIIILSILIILAILHFTNKRRSEKQINSRFEIDCLITTLVFMVLMSKLTPWSILLKYSFIHKITEFLQYSARLFYITQFLIDIIIVWIIFNDSINKWIRYGLLCAFSFMFILHFGVKSLDTYNGEALLYDEITGDYNSWRNNDYLLKGTQGEWLLVSVGRVSNEEKVASYEYKKTRGKVRYVYSTEYDGEYAEFPLICYPGYHAVTDYGEELKVIKGDKNRVRVMLKPSSEPLAVNVSYRVGLDFYIFDLVSILSFIICAILYKKHENVD